MKPRALKAKDGCSFWSYAKRPKRLSKINDSAKYFLQKWIISHPHVNQYVIVNVYSTVTFDNRIRGIKTELRQKMCFIEYLSINYI